MSDNKRDEKAYEGDISASDEVTSSKPKKKLIAIATVLTIVIAFLGGAAYLVNAENERAAVEAAEAHDEDVRASVADYQKRIEDYTPDLGTVEVDRNDALGKLPELVGLSSEIEANQESFKLSDGALYLYDEVLKNASDGAQTVRDWFATDYQSALDANAVPDLAADGVTKDALSASVSALEDLKSLVETEKQSSVWQSEDEYTSFIASVQAEQDRQNDRISELNAEEETRRAATVVETEYFTLQVPESWGGDFTFEDHSFGEMNRIWWLTPNNLDPFSPEQSDSHKIRGDYITIFVLGEGNGNGDIGFSVPNGQDFQAQKLFMPSEMSSGAHGGIIYPNKANAFAHVITGSSPFDKLIYQSPSQQQVDDAAYIVSTLVLK